MNATKNLLTNLCNLLVCACEAFRYGLTFLRAILCSRAVLAAKLLAVESQLAACKQRIDSKKRRRPWFTASFRLLWVVLSKFLDEWEDPPCNDTIGKYMYKPRKPRERSTTWLPFLRNHLDVSWAIDFFTATTKTLLRCTFSLFLIMADAESYTLQ